MKNLLLLTTTITTTRYLPPGRCPPRVLLGNQILYITPRCVCHSRCSRRGTLYLPYSQNQSQQRTSTRRRDTLLLTKYNHSSTQVHARRTLFLPTIFTKYNHSNIMGSSFSSGARVAICTDKPQYLAGQPVQAAVRVDLSKQIRLQNLYVQVTGFEKTCVEYEETETRKDSNGNDETITHTRSSYTQRAFFNQTVNLQNFGGRSESVSSFLLCTCLAWTKSSAEIVSPPSHPDKIFRLLHSLGSTLGTRRPILRI